MRLRVKQGALDAACLCAVELRDLGDRRLVLGFGTNRGMGEVKIEKIVFRGENLPDDLQELADRTINCHALHGSSAELKKSLACEWNAWQKRARGG
ncbi:MAG: hypothetical protein IRZ19_13165 [Pyrinomonas methylaliphatogenes]|nr:hypothetical protein [Pyrinomonas methylaliphatogenes]